MSPLPFRSAGPDPFERRANLERVFQTLVVRRTQLAMPPGAFARSCLNLWSTGAGEPVIDLEKWAECADEESDVDGTVAIAIDVSPNP